MTCSPVGPGRSPDPALASTYLECVTASLLTLDEIRATVHRVLAADAALDSAGTRSPDARHHIHAVYLFGSFGRGEAGPHSDVDLGLLYTTPPEHITAGHWTVLRPD